MYERKVNIPLLKVLLILKLFISSILNIVWLWILFVQIESETFFQWQHYWGMCAHFIIAGNTVHGIKSSYLQVQRKLFNHVS